MTITAGVDIGTGAVKAALFDVDGDRTEWLARESYRIRRRDPMQLAEEALDSVIAQARMSRGDVDYIATTGEGETAPFHTGGDLS